jgi:predicted DNA-binding transcriptional regulator AlpA
MPTKKISRKSEPEPTVFLTAPQVCQRYANRSHMWLERMLQRDPSFPRPHKFGRLRFFKIDELVDWERKTAAKSRAA